VSVKPERLSLLKNKRTAKVSWLEVAERTGAVRLLLSRENPVGLLTDVPPSFLLLVDKNPGYTSTGLLLII
jgi:Ni,Fe-hydrogenase I small subunit